MAEHRNVLAILAYNAGAPPSKPDFDQAMTGARSSLRRYFEDNLAGVVVLDRFDTFGPYAVSLPALSKAYSNEAPRSRVIEIARKAAIANGVDLRPYDTTIVVLHPASYVSASGQSFPYDVGADGGTGCLVPFYESGTYAEHELAHALGFPHSYGIPNTGNDWDGAANGWRLDPVYGDPYGMMSASTFGSSAPYMTLPAALPSYPAFHTVGPMLARAEVFHAKGAHMDQAGLVVHLTEGGHDGATIVAAGTGGPGRPELVAYHASGGGTILVELRKPGGDADRSWWDGGLEAGVDDEKDVPGVIVHTIQTPAGGSPSVFYSGRVVLPGPDADTTFHTSEGLFTVHVAFTQRALPDEVQVTVKRGAPAPTVWVSEDTVESVLTVHSELRTHPRYPDHQFTWASWEVTQTVTYTPTVVGIGVGWPDVTASATGKLDRYNTQLIWNTDRVVNLSAPGGTSAGYTWTFDADTGVLTLTNDPKAGTISVPVYANAYDITEPNTQTILANATTKFEVQGQQEGWGVDFFEFITARLRELLSKSMPVAVGDDDDDDVKVLVEDIRDTFQVLRDDRPDLAQQFEVDVRRRQEMLLARPDIVAGLDLEKLKVDIGEISHFQI